jgi:hypothetical protein
METQTTRQSKEVHLDKDQEFDNEKDAQAAELLNNAWEALTVVDRANGYREPVRKNELDQFEERLEKAKQLQPSDDHLNETIAECESYLRDWKNRKFSGSKKLLIVSVIFGVYLVVHFVLLIFGGPLFAEFPTYIGIIYLAGMGGYYWAYSPPAWLRDSKNITGKIGILNLFSMLTRSYSKRPVEYTEYQDGYGNKTHDDWGSKAMNRGAITALLWILNLVITVLIMPLVSLTGALRFYVFYK